MLPSAEEMMRTLITSGALVGARLAPSLSNRRESFLLIIVVVSFISHRWDCRTAVNGYRRERGSGTASVNAPYR
jgi:hypothetical protein